MLTNLPHASTCVIENDDLMEIMAHRGKMLLISRVVEYDINARLLRSEYDIGKTCLFYDSKLDGVPAYACFEFMAQAVSALSGITGKILGRSPMIGFILSVSALEIKVPVFRPGDIVQAEVNGRQAVDMVSTYHCIARVGNAEAVSANIMVMDIEDPMEFIRDGNDNRG